MLTPYRKLYNEKTAALFQLLLISFFFTKKWNSLILNVLNYSKQSNDFASFSLPYKFISEYENF